MTKTTPTLEDLLEHIVAEFKQVNTLPIGTVVRGPSSDAEGESIGLHPRCHYEMGCPKNFGEFVPSANSHGMSPSDAFSWYARACLRYSCSTMNTMFVRHLVPALKKRLKNKTELYSTTISESVRLEDLEIQTVLFSPTETRHSIVLEYGIMPAVVDVIEALGEFPHYCSHNMLKCRRTGVVVDPALGQFTGTLTPHVFRDINEFQSILPGNIHHVYACPSKSIDDQLARDSHSSHRSSPDFLPSKFAKRVIGAMEAKKPFCWNCYGVAGVTSSLKHCTRCHEALYCSKECQRLHWKKHKIGCCK